MEHEGLLIGIAEISIALTGFAGVVVVLGRRPSGPWPLADQFQLRSLIENGLLVVLAALLPFAVLQHTHEPSVIWRVSRVFHGTFGPYLYGLLWDLAMGAVFFVRLVRFS